jgi:predicted negative regulator of RcsB-dependent stress response
MDNLEASFNEHQKTEQLKAFFKKYGKQVITGIIAVLLLISIWQYWQHYKIVKSDEASQIYLQLLDSVNKQDKASIQAVANELIKNYSVSPYAKIAAFALAQEAVKAGKLDEATVQLRWIITHSNQAFLSELAQVRLAQILLSQKQDQAALDTVKGAEKIYPVETAFVKARALLALGKVDEARKELQQSIDATPADSSLRSILEMYLNDL